MGAATQRVVHWIADNGVTSEQCHPYLAKQRSVCPKDNDYPCDDSNAQNTRYAKGAKPTTYTASVGPSPHVKEI